jgi:Tfp pilus assembly protein PilF
MLAELELGQHEQAIDRFNQSYALNPRQPLTLRALAAAHAVSGNLGEARRYLAELKQAAPQISDEHLLSRPTRLEVKQPELLRGLRLALSPSQ